MAELEKNKCSNALYNLAKSIGTKRQHDAWKFPTQRMPMGLVEYVLPAAVNVNQVGVKLEIDPAR